MLRVSMPLVGLLLLIVALLAGLWAGQRRLMYFPDRSVPPPEVLGLRDVESVTYRADDGVTLRGWFFPAGRHPAYTVLVCNGNGGNRAYRARLAQGLRARGLAVLLFDYRGFGDSAGTPTEAGLYADARASRDYLESRPDVDASRVVYFGESLGAAVAVHLAVEHAPAALVLRSPFTSMADVGAVHYPLLPVRWLVRDRYASLDRIARVTAPVLTIAGEGDGIVPVAQSRQLHAAVASRKAFVAIPAADHNDEALNDGAVLIDAVMRFLGEA